MLMSDWRRQQERKLLAQTDIHSSSNTYDEVEESARGSSATAAITEKLYTPKTSRSRSPCLHTRLQFNLIGLLTAQLGQPGEVGMEYPFQPTVDLEFRFTDVGLCRARTSCGLSQRRLFPRRTRHNH